MTDDGDYDIQDKKLTNVHRGTQNDHAIVLSQYEEGLNTKIDKNFLVHRQKIKDSVKSQVMIPIMLYFAKK